MNSVISMASGFIFGFGVMIAVMSLNWIPLIPSACAVVIMYANFTGFGE